MKLKLKHLLLISVAINVLILIWIPFHLSSVNSKIEENITKYPYLSKRIFVDDQNDILINFSSLRTSLRDYVAGADVPIALYFEYLTTGVSVG